MGDQMVPRTGQRAHILGRVLRSLNRRPGDPQRTTDPAVDRAIALCHALLSERGEVSGARLAAEVLTAYLALGTDEIERFFDRLVAEFSADPASIRRSAEAYLLDSSSSNQFALEVAVEPPRQELFRRFNMAPGGTPVLVEMRRRLLATLGDHTDRIAIDRDLVHLFRSWFNRGFLVLQRIDWRTSAVVLERLIQYEAVHEIHGWRDLRRRLEADRRCYAFFHPALPDEPLIFIEVALTNGIGASVQPLLDPDSPVDDPARATCALFYSITNCQKGLQGVSFGNLLIKQVVEDLGKEFPRLRTFATLSPIPGFHAWLVEQAQRGGVSTELAKLAANDDILGDAITGASPALRNEIITRCASYLMSTTPKRGAIDSVARFHLANGARMERLNWLGDTSGVALRRSLGMTVNYLYRLADVEQNHEAYAKHHRIAASRRFLQLARNTRPASGA